MSTLVDVLVGLLLVTIIAGPAMYCKYRIALIDRELDKLEGVRRPWWKHIITMNNRSIPTKPPSMEDDYANS